MGGTASRVVSSAVIPIHIDMFIGDDCSGLFSNSLQQDFNGSNTDGSFTTAVSNSSLSPLEISHSCLFRII